METPTSPQAFGCSMRVSWTSGIDICSDPLPRKDKAGYLVRVLSSLRATPVSNPGAASLTGQLGTNNTTVLRKGTITGCVVSTQGQ